MIQGIVPALRGQIEAEIAALRGHFGQHVEARRYKAGAKCAIAVIGIDIGEERRIGGFSAEPKRLANRHVQPHLEIVHRTEVGRTCGAAWQQH